MIWLAGAVEYVIADCSTARLFSIAFKLFACLYACVYCPATRPFYNLIGALSTSHEPHSFSRPATVVTHTTQPLFFLFLSFFHLARLPAPSTISLVHCLPLTNLIRSVDLLLLSLILLSLFFFSFSLSFTQPACPPLLQSHWCIVYLSRTSFVQSACYCCHSYYSASFFGALSLFLSLSPPGGPPPNVLYSFALYASFYTQWVWSEADSYPSTAMPYLNKT